MSAVFAFTFYMLTWLLFLQARYIKYAYIYQLKLSKYFQILFYYCIKDI